MSMIKNIIKTTAIFTIIVLLVGCASKKPQVLDGPKMVYKDSDYRTIYANVLDFDKYDGQPYFAVAFWAMVTKWISGIHMLKNFLNLSAILPLNKLSI